MTGINGWSKQGHDWYKWPKTPLWDQIHLLFLLNINIKPHMRFLFRSQPLTLGDIQRSWLVLMAYNSALRPDMPILTHIVTILVTTFLAPPAERQRSFSNADSSVVRRHLSVVVNFSPKIFISQKLPDNFFSFLVYSFLRKVPIYCINIDLIEWS